MARTQIGASRPAGEALIKVSDSASPPRRLLLGALAADIGLATYQQRLTEREAWDTLARGADFTPESDPLA